MFSEKLRELRKAKEVSQEAWTAIYSAMAVGTTHYALQDDAPIKRRGLAMSLIEEDHA